MREINIARVLVNKRKEKGITQDDLAYYMGVSKASVSKWETGQSYPDITLLPQLAAYFNISIDDLMDYQPQMSKEDIKRLYLRLSDDFTSKPYQAVLSECQGIIKKYYSCYPLLLQMGILLFNHLQLVTDAKEATALLVQLKELFNRIRTESDELPLSKTSLFLEALCCISSGDPNSALELLEGMNAPALPPETILASAYQMLGRVEEAKSVLQVGIYQDIATLFNFFSAYLMLCTDTPERFDEALNRVLMVAQTFDMAQLHPILLVQLYLCAAQGYLQQGRQNEALDMLERYTNLATGSIYPLKLHGDGFFDRIGSWLEELDLGTGLPRNEKTIQQSMVDIVTRHPSFAVLKDNPRYKSMIEKLQGLKI